jgi:tetrapyrrole methylase family protein/MazG family protein
MDDKRRLTIEELLRIMARLRGPGGCPWDREQDHRSLLPYLVEEAYEVLEAVEQGGDADLCAELGDLLLQIVFHAQMASERAAFDFTDVTDAISRKLIRRHPHVFRPEEVQGVDTAEKVLANWERLKRKERGEHSSVLQGLPRGLPALAYAQRMQEKAASVGFDWHEARGVWKKVAEEVEELGAVLEDPDQRAEELGDLLFALVNLARHLKLNAEDCLRASLHKFRRRFEAMEAAARSQGRPLSELGPDALEALWSEAKQAEAAAAAPKPDSSMH